MCVEWLCFNAGATRRLAYHCLFTFRLWMFVEVGSSDRLHGTREWDIEWALMSVGWFAACSEAQTTNYPFVGRCIFGSTTCIGTFPYKQICIVLSNELSGRFVWIEYNYPAIVFRIRWIGWFSGIWASGYFKYLGFVFEEKSQLFHTDCWMSIYERSCEIFIGMIER